MTEPDRTDLIQGAMEFIAENFPDLRPALSKGVPESLGYGVADGLCSHPGSADKRWFRSSGHRAFGKAQLPADLCFVGVQNRGSAEYLVAMWSLGDRRFWFYDSYVCFVADSDESIERTRASLAESLERWKRGDKRVVFSGPQGGWVDGADDDNGIPFL